MTPKELLEEIDAHAGLLRVYGDVNEFPTENELAIGCQDASRLLSRCADAIKSLRAQRAAKDEAIANVYERLRDGLRNGWGDGFTAWAEAWLAKRGGEEGE